MNASDEHTRSLWMTQAAVAPEARRLAEDLTCDVVIVGAGIAGLSVAYELSQIGKAVVVLDRGRLAGGVTSRTTAHLAPVCDDGVGELTKIRGEEMAAKFQASQSAAVDRIETIVRKHNIACDFRRLDAYLFPAPGMSFKDAREEQDEEYKALRAAKVDVEKARVRVPDERGWCQPTSFQSVGLGMASAIGAALAQPHRLVTLAIGDGGLLMSLGELETAVRLGVRMCVVVYNDLAYGAEVHYFGRRQYSVDIVRFANVDFSAIARGVAHPRLKSGPWTTLLPFRNGSQRKLREFF